MKKGYDGVIGNKVLIWEDKKEFAIIVKGIGRCGQIVFIGIYYQKQESLGQINTIFCLSQMCL